MPLAHYRTPLSLPDPQGTTLDFTSLQSFLSLFKIEKETEIMLLEIIL